MGAARAFRRQRARSTAIPKFWKTRWQDDRCGFDELIEVRSLRTMTACPGCSAPLKPEEIEGIRAWVRDELPAVLRAEEKAMRQ